MDIFRLLRLEINWSTGKTEVFLTLRGKNAVMIRETLRSGGNLRIPVPGTSDVLTIVAHYKHLGSVVAADRSNVPYVKARASSAMASYVPLAMTIFVSSEIGLALKFTFQNSLIMSKLAFNAHVRCPEPEALKLLNSVYMRSLRRIASEVYMDGSKKKTDLEVRRILGRPSLDCLIQRSRL